MVTLKIMWIKCLFPYFMRRHEIDKRRNLFLPLLVGQRVNALSTCAQFKGSRSRWTFLCKHLMPPFHELVNEERAEQHVVEVYVCHTLFT